MPHLRRPPPAAAHVRPDALGASARARGAGRLRRSASRARGDAGSQAERPLHRGGREPAARGRCDDGWSHHRADSARGTGAGPGALVAALQSDAEGSHHGSPAEANGWTGFADRFTHFRTGEAAATGEPALMGAILADATNLGLDRPGSSAAIPLCGRPWDTSVFAAVTARWVGFGAERCSSLGGSGRARPYVRPVLVRRQPLAVMGVRLRARRQSPGRARGALAIRGVAWTALVGSPPSRGTVPPAGSAGLAPGSPPVHRCRYAGHAASGATPAPRPEGW